VSDSRDEQTSSPAADKSSKKPIHRRQPINSDELDALSPDSRKLSPGSARVDDSAATEPATDSAAAAGRDIAAGALDAARSMAGGRARSIGIQRRRYRLRNPDGPTYSGARSDERDPARLGSIVGRALPELGWVKPLAEARILSQWADVVGADIAARCQPVSLVDGNLKITAETTAWATQLRMMAPQILAKVTDGLPRGIVTRLVITGPVGPSWKHGPWSSRGRGVRDTYG
jgi:predicted nucleic acid-binding Zn ribbon protein